MIDTAQTSNFEQASTTVYAQGGRGYNRLIAWEGEKTMTFTVTDALMSPMGLAVLSGAGLIDNSLASGKVAHIHVTYDVALGTDGAGTIEVTDLARELGVAEDTVIRICQDVPAFATVLNSAGAIEEYVEDAVTITGTEDTDNTDYIKANNGKFGVTIADCAGKTVKLDFYAVLPSGVQTVSIEPDSFGGYFYVEADTLFRDEATGKDMAASIVFPKVKVQSAMTFTMAASGDPSTFDFVMDAMPAYTWFDTTKKVVCDIQIVSGADETDSRQHAHVEGINHVGTHSKN